MKCKYKVGLLNLQDCGAENAIPCGDCGRPVCAAHYRQAQDKMVCLECFTKQMPGDKPYVGQDETIRNAFWRRSMYSGGYRPYYYGHGVMYGNDDYEYFDQRTRTGGDEQEEIEPKDFQDS